ncbi:MAG: winged helix-turn-helix transcriptional regulator [Alcanivoracaceae bacterium]|nr:winged helix-turn-helix transcriptional regulator [Alcanivoracaceae bacterium]
MKHEIAPCYNLAMRKSSRLINQFYEDRLATVGLKVGQFSLLRAVHYCKKTTNKDLQRILVLDQTTLSRNLKPLFRDELLKLSMNARDKRVKIISLSPKGKKLYLQALPLWNKAQEDLQTKIGAKDSMGILELSKVIVNELSA